MDRKISEKRILMMNLTKEEERLIQESAIFNEFSSEELREFFKNIGAYVKLYGKGEFLFYEGDIVDQIGVILSGEVAIVKLYPDGAEHLLQKLKEGYMTGIEIACTEKKVSPYSTCSLSDVKILKIPYQYIEEEGTIEEKQRLKLQNKILKFIASENIRKYYKINILSSRSLRERILLYLEVQSRKRQSLCFEIPFDRAQFANYLCVNRSALSKELSKMQEAGLIRYHKNKFEILRLL